MKKIKNNLDSPKWKLTRIKKLDNKCSIIEFAVETPEPETPYDFCVLGVLLLPDYLFDGMYAEGPEIQRQIVIVREPNSKTKK